MESLAVGLLILTLTSQWGGFLYILKRITDVERALDDKVDKARERTECLERDITAIKVSLARSGFGPA